MTIAKSSKRISMMRLTGLLFFLIINQFSFAQSSANDLINRVNEKFNLIRDYKASVSIRTDIPFIKMLPVNATIYFKQPDKFHIESKGIAILPKQTNGLMLDVLGKTNSYIAIDAGQSNVNEVITKMIKVIPTSDTSDLILGTFYIEEVTAIIHKAQVTTRSRGTVDVQMKYGKYSQYNLPDTLIFEMDVNKFKIPKAVAADLESKPKKDDGKKTTKGKVTITYKEYTINKGIDDSVFKTKK